MMTAGNLAEALHAKLLTDGTADQEIDLRGCYIGDLLSNVMARAKEGEVWMTVVTNQNILAVAHLLNLPAVILLEGHQPAPGILDKAKEERIPLFSSEESAYELAVRFRALDPAAGAGQ
jgi:serine kinase of HPr protein (carbohydrate metabolism regulator)